MTISRPARRRWPAIVAAAMAGIVAGLLLGLALGGDDESDPLSGVRDARSSLVRAAGVLEIVDVEYGQGIEDGRVVSAPEYRGASDAVRRSREHYAEARPVLAFIESDATARVDRAYEQLESAIAERVAQSDVDSQARALQQMLRRLSG